MRISPIEHLLREVEEGKIDPLDVDVTALVERFLKEAEKMKGEELFWEASLFLRIATRLMKLKLDALFPDNSSKRRKITFKEIKKVIEEECESEDALDTLDWLYDYTPAVGRPSGAKTSPQPPSAKKVDIPLHKEPDWKEEAKRIYGKLKKGGRIENLRDFIAFLFAYMEYEDLSIPPYLRAYSE